MFFNHLCLGALRAHAGRSQFDHLSELGDGLGWGLGRLGQFLLAGCCSSNQQLGVLHQRLGCLQDALPDGGDTLSQSAPQTHSSTGNMTQCVLSIFGYVHCVKCKWMFSWHIALVSESSETECSSGVSVSKPSNWNLKLNQPGSLRKPAMARNVPFLVD